MPGSRSRPPPCWPWQLLRPAFGLLLLTYLVSSLCYTLWLRREPVLELTLVALGFLLRAAGGGVAAGIPISSWFLLVAGFGSLFVVAGKRYCELVAVDRPGPRRACLAGYSAPYLRFVWGTAGALTLASYAAWGNDVYRVRPHGAWALMSLFPFLVALLLYARKVDAGTAEAPEDVVLHDRALQLLGVAWLVMVAVGAGGISGG
jgi:decaprenyl-phosphate phosphoribosyltransferase